MNDAKYIYRQLGLPQGHEVPKQVRSLSFCPQPDHRPSKSMSLPLSGLESKRNVPDSLL